MTDEALDLELLTLPEQIAVKLGQDIVEGRYAVGARLSEPQLAQHYGVSRGPIREALHQLDVHGFIEHRPRLGARVSRLSRYELQQLADVKGRLLSLVARYAARNVKDEHLEVLNEGLVSLEKTALGRPVNIVDFFAQTRGLWRVIHRAADAKRISSINDFVMGSAIWQMVFWDKMQRSLVSLPAPELLKAWQALIQAIEVRDPDLAEQRVDTLMTQLRTMFDEVLPGD